MCGPIPPGGKIFNDDSGLRKIITKYPTMQIVRSNITMERISHIAMAPPRDRDCVPSKSKSSFIYGAPFNVLSLIGRCKDNLCLLTLVVDPFFESNILQSKQRIRRKWAVRI